MEGAQLRLHIEKSADAHNPLTLSTCSFGRFGANAKVVHFLGQIKPWNYTYSSQTKSVKYESQDPSVSHPEFLNLWWDIFTTSVVPLLQHYGLVKDACSYLMMVGFVCFHFYFRKFSAVLLKLDILIEFINSQYYFK